MVELADLIKVSDEDLSLLYPEQDPQRVIEGWLQHRCQLVFLTRGGEGATVFSRTHGSWSVPACSVKIADTVGAGDTFQAALITWLTEQQLDSVEGVQSLEPRADRRDVEVCGAGSGADVQQDRAGFAVSAAAGNALKLKASSRAGSLPHWSCDRHKINVGAIRSSLN